MKKKVLAVIVFVFSLASIFYFVFQELSRNKLASLRIASNVDIPISVNGRQVGMKFYEGVDKPGQVDIKIGDYETRVITHAGIKTIVNRNFERDKSYGETLSFEETGLAEPIVAIVTDPIGARVSIDDKFYGVAPLNVEGLTEGKHKLDVALDGYVRDTFSINLAANFKM